MDRIIIGELSTDQILKLCNKDVCQSKLGIEAKTLSTDGASVVYHIKDWHMNFEGTVHGGILFSVLDSVMGMAVFPHLKADEHILAIDQKINYLKGATLNMKDLTSTANLVSRTRRLAVAEGEIYSPDGTILSKALGTFAILKQPD